MKFIFLKEADTVLIGLHGLFDFKKLNLTWLAAATLVQLIMTEADIECGYSNSKANLRARGINTNCKIITFSHLSSTNVSVGK